MDRRDALSVCVADSTYKPLMVANELQVGAPSYHWRFGTVVSFIRVEIKEYISNRHINVLFNVKIYKVK